MGFIFSGMPRLKIDSNVNIVCDGDSLTAGIGATNSYPTQLAALSPFAGIVSVTNCGINGQTFEQMITDHSDVDAAWVSGKTNILLVFGEPTNSIFGLSDTSSGAFTQLTNYVAAVKAVHPWRVIVGTAIPRESTFSRSGSTLVAENNQLIAYSALLRSGYRSIGVSRIADMDDAGIAFANIHSPYADADFDGVGAIWDTSTSGTRIHYNDAGYGIVAQTFKSAILRLPAR